MRIPVDRHDATPLYRQIEAWLRDNIASGGLPDATRLPSTRSLADDLGVSRITVANAYAVLESDGLLFSRNGSATCSLDPNRTASRPAVVRPDRT